VRGGGVEEEDEEEEEKERKRTGEKAAGWDVEARKGTNV
jgi:hypothetical protein